MHEPFSSIETGCVHLWIGDVFDCAASMCTDLMLSSEERIIAGGLRFRMDRSRYVATRAVLRQVLSGYLGMEPDQVNLRKDQHGKPYLDEATNARSITFNMSHSGDYIAVAVGCEHENGVDIQLIDTNVNFLDIARLQFSAHEYHALLSHLPGERRAAFFRGWCRKEAYSKALKQGLARPLSSYDVSLRGDEQPVLLNDSLDAQADAVWTIWPITELRNLDIEGAIAVRRQVRHVRTFDLSSSALGGHPSLCAEVGG